MKKNIRFYITQYDPYFTGAGKSLTKLVTAIDKNKYNVEIVTSAHANRPKFEDSNGYKVIRIGYAPHARKNFISITGKIIFTIYSAIYSILNREYDTAVFIGVGLVSLPSLIVSKLLSKRLVNKTTSMGDDDPSTLTKSFIGRVIVKLLKNEHHWVISEEIRKSCLEHTNWSVENLHLITNPVKVTFNDFNDLIKCRVAQKNRERPRFLFVGELNKRKGVDLLLNLWGLYSVEADLVLCGPRCEDVVINKLLNCADESRVHEKGELNQAQVEVEYLNADVFLFCSSREGLPNVVLEAMAMGVPIISNNIVGTIDFLLGPNNERGVVIQDITVDTLHCAVDKYITNSRERVLFSENAKLAHKWIVNNSEYSVVLNKLEGVF
jgi:glycosyltransferase involved in cell wall biosynthesis